MSSMNQLRVVDDENDFSQQKPPILETNIRRESNNIAMIPFMLGQSFNPNTGHV